MSKRATFLAITLPALLVIAVLATGCTNYVQQKTSEQALEQALERNSNADVDVSRDGESVTIKTDEGEASTLPGSLPADWPSDVAVYPGATILNSFITTVDESASATLETDADVQTVTDWYKSEIEKAGWIISRTDSWGTGADQLTTYIASKDDRELSVGVSTREDMTTIVIGVYKQTSL